MNRALILKLIDFTNREYSVKMFQRTTHEMHDAILFTVSVSVAAGHIFLSTDGPQKNPQNIHKNILNENSCLFVTVQ